MADLKDLPIGTGFWYLQRRCVVVAHYPKSIQAAPDTWISLRCQYADEDGVIRDLSFEEQSLDLVAELVAHSRVADEQDRKAVEYP